MSLSLKITGPARKQLAGIPVKDRQRIIQALLAIQAAPFLGDVKRLRGQSAGWRRRVGSYRIFYDVYPKALLIVISSISRRTSNTY